MEILLVGQADSIFFEHYTKSVKKLRDDINFDIFSVDNVCGKYDLSACQNIYINSWCKSRIRNIKGLRTIMKPFITWFSLYRFLHKNKKKYDIIHYKWLIPGIVLFPGKIRKFAKKNIATFWGGELENQNILYSNNLYRYCLKHFLRSVDFVTYSVSAESIGIPKEKLFFANYGSSIYDEILYLQKSDEKRNSKIFWNINPDKITISIGYSGKEVHQHVKILNELFKNEDFLKIIDDIIFVLPLTHGGNDIYYSKILKTLNEVDAKYLLVSNKMSDYEVARLRHATDIMLQLSLTDGRSASIIETILAGSILVAGTWLPYKFLNDNNIFFIEVDNINRQVPLVILDIMKSISDLEKQTKNNYLKMDIETWDKVILDWIRVYE